MPEEPLGLSTTSVVEHAGNGVIHTKIQAGRNEETGESFAGGLVGSFGLAGNVYGNYTRETTVTADGDNVGRPVRLYGRRMDPAELQ